MSDAPLLNAQKLKGEDKKHLKQAEQLQDNKKYEPALKLYEGLRQSHTDNTDILLGIGYCQKQLRKFDDAINTYQQLIEILEEKIAILDFSVSKKDEKKQKSLVILKRNIKRKLKGCKSLKEDENQQSEKRLREDVYGKSQEENKKPENRSTIKPPVYEQHPGMNKKSNKRKQAQTSGATTFVPHKININNGGFLTNYIGLQSKSEKYQKKEIKNYIAEIYDALEEGMSSHKYDYKDVMGINNSWMKDNRLKSYSWFEDLKKKEKQYREIQDQYDAIVSKKRMLENELKTSISDNLLNAQKIEINKKDSLNLIRFRDYVLKDELKSKLSTIPQSIDRKSVV